jgi:hypothetical protein
MRVREIEAKSVLLKRKYSDLLDDRDRAVVILEQMDYLFRLRGGKGRPTGMQHGPWPGCRSRLRSFCSRAISFEGSAQKRAL